MVSGGDQAEYSYMPLNCELPEWLQVRRLGSEVLADRIPQGYLAYLVSTPK